MSQDNGEVGVDTVPDKRERLELYLKNSANEELEGQENAVGNI